MARILPLFLFPFICSQHEARGKKELFLFGSNRGILRQQNSFKATDIAAAFLSSGYIKRLDTRDQIVRRTFRGETAGFGMAVRLGRLGLLARMTITRNGQAAALADKEALCKERPLGEKLPL